jgi:hypothetical protein
MSSAEPTALKQRVIGVPFKPGQSGNPAGRPKGARNKLAENFVADLHTAWERDGADVLARVARDDPGTLLKVMASLVPRDFSLTVGLDAAGFGATFKAAVAMLGNVEPPRRRRPLPNQPRTIDHVR